MVKKHQNGENEEMQNSGGQTMKWARWESGREKKIKRETKEKSEN